MFFKIQNDIFELCIDKDVGGVCGLIYKPDREMQWIKSGYYFNIPRNFRKDRFGHKEFQLVDSCCDNNSYSATFEIPDLTIKSTYFFNENG